MTLTGKQKRALKSLGQTMSDDLSMGKAGPSDGVFARLGALLTKKELVKVRFTELEGDARRELAAQVSQAVGAQCVAVVGRTILLYRANPELEPDQRVLKSDGR
ncbi:MAG: YhbY family RNA-binding protein [Planctomycetes bacterium]|nr:YhbY family RNA-binding protein [Planctomycetota bacterium]